MVEVVVSNATKFYGGRNGFKALSDVSVAAKDGEFLVLLGPSGSGKTTLLRTIAGLEHLDIGDIFIGSKRVNNVDPGKRDIGMVFQDYALYPHMNVRQNISYNMKLRKLSSEEVDQRTTDVATMLGLEGLLDRRPAQLSGGQRQRVALGRAITRDGSLLLMDEPLSNLDAQIREHVRVELKELQRKIGVTTIHVTHDQVEAMVVADRVAVMSHGRIEQIDKPEIVYDLPATLFCARFVGSPKTNEIRGSVRRVEENTVEFSIASNKNAPSSSLQIKSTDIDLPLGEANDTVLVFRPEDIRIVPDDEAGISVTLHFVENRGSEKFAVVELPPDLRHAQASADLRVKVGRTGDEPQTLSFTPTRAHVFEESSGNRIASGGCSVISAGAPKKNR